MLCFPVFSRVILCGFVAFLVQCGAVASFFKKQGSGFYYLKVKRQGKWKAIPTTIRFSDVDALRRVRRMALEESARELAEERGDLSDWGWVIGFLSTQFRQAPDTLRRYLEAWTALEVYLAEKKVGGPAGVTHALCFDYPKWRTAVDPAIMKPCHWNTALLELKVLSRVMSEAVRRGMVTANPCFRLGLRRQASKVKPEVTPEDQKIIEAALKDRPAWMRECWTVAMCQGFRLSETNCPIDRIDMKTGTISVIGKGKVHTAPLHPEVKKLALIAKKAGRKTLLSEFPGKASLHWTKFFHRLGLGHLTFHSTRVTVVTRLARSGASQAQTMAYVGHASETVHAVYMRLSAPDVAHLGKFLHVQSPKA